MINSRHSATSHPCIVRPQTDCQTVVVFLPKRTFLRLSNCVWIDQWNSHGVIIFNEVIASQKGTIYHSVPKRPDYLNAFTIADLQI